MPEFAQLQRSALCLPDRLNESAHLNCMFFLQALVQDTTACKQAATVIKQLATTMLPENDTILAAFMQQQNHTGRLINIEDFHKFKENVLVGGYLLVWYQANERVGLARLTELLGADLGCESITDIEQGFSRTCLASLIQYCTFAHAQLQKDDYRMLMQLLGQGIVLKIEAAMSSLEPQSFFGSGREMLSAIGINI